MLSEVAAWTADFLRNAAETGVEFYNEAALQHELGIYLRSRLPRDHRLQFERPVGYFIQPAPRLGKKEIDIVIFARQDGGERIAIEIKCPRSGQYPEQMFKACQDLEFLERLTDAGFSGGLFVMHVVDPLFFARGRRHGIYGPFRAGEALSGEVSKPTDARGSSATLRGRYAVEWTRATDGSVAWVQPVRPAGATGFASGGATIDRHLHAGDKRTPA